MKFDAEKIKKTTFPVASFSGYRKYDVDDFLYYVAKDYRRFEQDKEDLKEEIEMLTTHQKKQAEEMSKERSEYVVTIHEQKKEIEDLERQLRDLQFKQKQEPVKPTGSTFQEAILISQEAALEIERSAEIEGAKIIEEAHVERGRIIKEAKEEQAQLMREAQAKREGLQQEMARLIEQMEAKKQEMESTRQQELMKLEQEKAVMLEEAKNELAQLAEQMEHTKQELELAKREEINFRDTLIYDYKAALARVNDEKWEHWATAYQEELQKIQA
ncbi:DivIVA domain-containing protein [Enterococcus pallens]|uniref:DivIVA domain-containing protein n=2 Tax=Enterococcus pallens TaxID=160454 RepID=R2SI14_9ENTE|nr:DivIVA domain-containing protein [Enterococcus pallens]EOH92476.1 DivIVA domain-containing protein [Enterococcus pallens ATCC BAA-351]EOU25061.1 hypothetical protein I588_01049 [Enterococcus pallens ATCC BAA-351]